MVARRRVEGMVGGMLKLVIATHNGHKTEEIRAMLSGLAEVDDLSSYPEIPAADETGVTFEENAAIKALEAGKVLGEGGAGVVGRFWLGGGCVGAGSGGDFGAVCG